ncbi:hypothetical protein [Actinokineospora globicatena]|uniref:Uncharacterized protein n=1 Tax=Actinokineospora globicatena TaxID=103729 RepID=A0A9W6QMG3_9PSEU|nr:hypothetical protein [Actinokineospora globicatena]MCP2304215.1 hypothetical protein [Actinokineospora globicatena]GLW78426.1 hypothetical protein Aglo01_29080 [Actinokineospora globicatena]GLW84910.1 hypothetical protein Aglo02_25500 [Actinokineospora globicatena]GLW91033.1 hypothetical protein Aglo03_18490 [Actinokineospora globicatena]
MRTLIRIAGWAGLLCSLVLLLNAGRRGGVLPDTAFGHAVAPLGQVFGLLLMIGVYLVHAKPTKGLTVGFVLNVAGLGAVLGVEYILNFVFPELDPAVVRELQAGFTGKGLLVSSIVFLIGITAYGIALISANLVPRAAIAIYLVSFVCVALRPFLPTFVLPIAVAVGAVATTWLALSLLGKLKDPRGTALAVA